MCLIELLCYALGWGELNFPACSSPEMREVSRWKSSGETPRQWSHSESVLILHPAGLIPVCQEGLLFREFLFPFVVTWGKTMLLLNLVEINLVSSESRGWPTFLSKLETRKGSKKQEHGSSDVTLESGCQILLDTRYIALTSDTRGNNWGLFDQGKITKCRKHEL